MTATSGHFTLDRDGWRASLIDSISRNELFAGLYFLACANGLLGRFFLSVSFIDGWTGAAIGLDINAVVIFACFAGLVTLYSAEKERVRSADLLIAIPFIGLVLLPIYALSWVAVTGLSLYILFFATGSADRRRGALILLALTVPMLWSRLLFQFFAKPILDIDAALVASLLGTERIGNMVHFASGEGFMVVLSQCSSLANMSLAFLCWVSVTQWAKHQWTPMDLVWSALACVSVIAVNVTRITVMGMSKAHYDAIHGEWGDLVANTLMLILMVTFSVIGARRELFGRS